MGSQLPSVHVHASVTGMPLRRWTCTHRQTGSCGRHWRRRHTRS